MNIFNIEWRPNKYKDKSILVVGGGTSTLDVNWEDIEYDYLWTCNDFYLVERVLNKDIDLYFLSHTTPFNDVLTNKLKGSDTLVFYEPYHYRQKQESEEFINFQKDTGINIFGIDIPFHDNLNVEGRKAGVTGRLIQLAMYTDASKIYFVGFDGFNKEFSNRHAFTKHVGLKESDLRRDWKNEYYEVFVEAYCYLVNIGGFQRLQNLGEGFDYNLGTEISKKYLKKKKKTLEILGKGPGGKDRRK